MNLKIITVTTLVFFGQIVLCFGQTENLLSPTAKSAFDRQDFAPCIAEMTKLLTLKPKNDAALVERARCLFLSADDTKDEERILAVKLKTITDKATAEKAAGTEVLSLRRKAIADATQAVALNPQNAAAFNVRGLVKSSLGTKDRAEAIADYDKAIEIDPKFIKPYFNRGSSKADNGDYNGAIADFTKVLEFEPNNIAAMENRVIAMIGKSPGKPNLEAFNELKAIIKLSPAKEENYFLAGVECFNFPNKYECVDFFKQYTAAFPKSYDAFIGLARAGASVEYYSDVSPEKRLSYWREAVAAYDITFRLKPNSLQPYIEVFDLAVDKFRNAESAETLSKAAVGLFPDDPQSYLLAGRAAIASEKYDKAVTDLTRAIELRPTFGLAYTYRGVAFNYLRNSEKAIADLNKAIELDAYNGTAFMNRGAFFESQNKYQQAIADYTQADRLNKTCAKTYRGRVYVRIAFDNKELQNSENFKHAHQNFINDDAKKCYDTHYQYGITLYSEAFNKEAAEQFDLALRVYKKFNYDTTKIVEWQNKVKTVAANAPTNSGKSSEQVIALYKLESIRQGATLIGSGIYKSAETTIEFNVEGGETYVLVAVSEGDSTYGIDLYASPNNEFLKANHKWEDNNYKMESFMDYAMKSNSKKIENNTILQFNLGLTYKTRIRKIRLFPNKEKGKSIHWLFYKLK